MVTLSHWALQAMRLRLFYDGDYPVCRLAVERLSHTGDFFGLIEPVSFRDLGFVPPNSITLDSLEKRMYLENASHKIGSGIDAIQSVQLRPQYRRQRPCRP
jgi:hypothetical protein